jgi:hypothetical protein
LKLSTVKGAVLVGDKTDSRCGGRFLKGNPGGPGRPRREAEVSYLTTIAKAYGPREWEAICRRAVDQAKGRDARAREWLASHLVGLEPEEEGERLKVTISMAPSDESLPP